MIFRKTARLKVYCLLWFYFATDGVVGFLKPFDSEQNIALAVKRTGSEATDIILEKLTTLHKHKRLTYAYMCQVRLYNLLETLPHIAAPCHTAKILEMLGWDEVYSSGYDSFRHTLLETMREIGGPEHVATLKKCREKIYLPNFSSGFSLDYMRKLDAQLFAETIGACATRRPVAA